MKDSDAYKLPANFRWPTERDYAEAVTGAYSQVGFDSSFSRAVLSPPVQSQVNGVVSAFQASTQKGITELAAQLSSATGSEIPALAGKVASLAFALANGNVLVALQTGAGFAAEIASKIAAELGTELAQEVAGVVPLVSVVVGYVMLVVERLFGGMTDEEKAKLVADAKTALEKRLTGDCPNVAKMYAGTATGPEGATPADMFRGVLLAAETGHPLPPTLASLYLMFAGGESQGVGMTRREWRALDAKARNKSGAKGFDQYTQRRIFALIKSIMRAAKNPSLEAQWQVWGDGGVAAFGTLNEIMRTGFLRGHWNLAYSRALEEPLGQFWGDYKTVQFDQGFQNVYARCGDKLGLTDQLEQTQLQYIGGMIKHFCVPGGKNYKWPEKCEWRATATAAQLAELAANRPSFTLTLSGRSAAELIGSAQQSEESQEGASVLPAVGLAAAVVGAAYWSATR